MPVVMLLWAFLLSGCAAGDTSPGADSVQGVSFETIVEDSGTSDAGSEEGGGVSGDALQEDDDSAEESVEANPDEGNAGMTSMDESDWETLRFVDVFGEEYETKIHPLVAKQTYDNSGYRRDGDLLYYEDDAYTSRIGVDVSYHQGTIDWNRVREAGVSFAFIRIGYRGYGTAGVLREDTEARTNIKNAQAAGIDVGVYLFSQAVNETEAREEAEFAISFLRDFTLQLPVVYDPEHILDDTARTDNVSGEQFTENTILFCRMMEEAGYTPAIYSNMLWEAFEYDLSRLADYPVWYADYEPYPQTPYAFRWWQYTNEGHVPGISGQVDLNIEMVGR